MPPMVSTGEGRSHRGAGVREVRDTWWSVSFRTASVKTSTDLTEHCVCVRREDGVEPLERREMRSPRGR